MKVLITGGGTAGHITPLLAIAVEIKGRHSISDIRYIGQRGDSMIKMIKESSSIDRCYTILAGKWRRYHGVGFWAHFFDIQTVIKNLRDLIYISIGFWQSIFLMIRWRPNVVFCKGGFVSLPVGLAAALLRLPIVTHDSDAVPGLTNRILSRHAKILAVGLPCEAYKGIYPRVKMRYTGVPIRLEFYMPPNDQNQLRHQLGYSLEDKIITVIGGSLGAIRLNKMVLESLDELLAKPSRYLIWITGQRQYVEITEQLKNQPTGLLDRIKVYKFLDNPENVLSVSDIVVSRAGATAIAELAVLAKPVVLVPNPYLTNGHQLKNAAQLEKQKACLVVQENEPTNNLVEKINELFDNQPLKTQISDNLHKIAVNDAAAKIVDAIEEVIT